jgi:hypothetical protein
MQFFHPNWASLRTAGADTLSITADGFAFTAVSQRLVMSDTPGFSIDMPRSVFRPYPDHIEITRAGKHVLGWTFGRDEDAFDRLYHCSLNVADPFAKIPPATRASRILIP